MKGLGAEPLLVLVRSDGTAASSISMPPQALFSRQAIDGLSPNARFFAYFIGDIGNFSDPPRAGESQFYLTIVQIPDGTQLASVLLLSPLYPSDLLGMASTIKTSRPEGYEEAAEEQLALGILNAFQIGATSLDWSPDSALLAYASQNPGPSSDLYVIDPTSPAPARLSSGPEMIQSIDWSPDGHWIAHSSIMAAAMGVNQTWHFATPDGSALVSYDSVGDQAPGWLDPHSFAVTDGANGIGSFDLKLLQPGSRHIVSLWPQPYQSYALDPTSSLLAVGVLETRDASDPSAGAYLVPSPYTSPKLISERPFISLDYWGTPTYEFLAGTIDETIVGIAPDGQVAQLAPLSATRFPSPDKRYIALMLWTPTPAGLALLDISSLAQTMITTDEVREVLWAPDSASIFYATSRQLFRYDLATSTSTLIDTDLGEQAWWVSYKWTIVP
jgi:dipeptidyl aminopeptidase/acylaminoacyl peptidase